MIWKLAYMTPYDETGGRLNAVIAGRFATFFSSRLSGLMMM
jgi:hypothetical protein